MSAAPLRRSVASLSIPNYRRFFVGQVVSVSGNWMQNVAAMWLVLHLTGSGTMVGLTAAAQFTPLLLLGAWGGLLADRFPKRRLLTVTQTLLALPPLTLFVLVTTGAVQAWMVLALAFLGGIVTAFDNPARQSFVVEIVGADRVVNAVSLNSVLVQSSRIAGPGAAALVIALGGVGPCFLLNGLSFFVMIAALRRMNGRELQPAPPANREKGQLRAALRYVAATPALRLPLVTMAVVGTFSFNFPTLLPLLARFTFHGTATAFALLSSALAVGSIVGALTMGGRERVDNRFIAVAAFAFGATTLLAAVAPSYGLMLLALVLVGAASVSFSAGTNSAVQLEATPEMRGRVMALYSIVFIGSTPIGAPIVGFLASAVDPRAGLALGGIAALATGVVALAGPRRARRAAERLPAAQAVQPDLAVDHRAHVERRARRGEELAGPRAVGVGDPRLAVGGEQPRQEARREVGVLQRVEDVGGEHEVERAAAHELLALRGPVDDGHGRVDPVEREGVGGEGDPVLAPVGGQDVGPGPRGDDRRQGQAAAELEDARPRSGRRGGQRAGQGQAARPQPRPVGHRAPGTALLVTQLLPVDGQDDDDAVRARRVERDAAHRDVEQRRRERLRAHAAHQRQLLGERAAQDVSRVGHDRTDADPAG